MPTETNGPTNVFRLRYILTFLSVLSPIILPFSIVGLSFVFQNTKGLIYFGFLVAASILRFLVLNNANYKKSISVVSTKNSNGVYEQVPVPQKCNEIEFGPSGDSHFSFFVFVFTLIYVFAPMFMYHSYNFTLFTGVIAYSVLDIVVKNRLLGCVTVNGLLWNALTGFILGASFVAVMMLANTNSRSYLFFNELSADKEVCSVAKNQTFKCSVYKNGELIGNV